MSARSGDGRRYKVARVFNKDAGADLVLFQLANDDGTRVTGVAPLKIATSGVHEGQQVFTVSSPGGLPQTGSRGVLLATRRKQGRSDLLITAPVSPGSSGGPVFNTAGEVVGVITGHIPAHNINLAIPIESGVRLLNAPVSTEVERLRRHTRGGSLGPNELFDRGNAAYEKKHYRIAAGYFERVLASRPTAPEALYNLALCHRELGNSNSANEYFQRFLEAADLNDAAVPFAREWVANYAARRTAVAAIDIPLDSPDPSTTIPPSTSLNTPSRSTVSTSNPHAIPVSIDGMSPFDVRMLLGQPSMTRADPNGVITWFYDMEGETLSVFFLSDRASLDRPR